MSECRGDAMKDAMDVWIDRCDRYGWADGKDGWMGWMDGKDGWEGWMGRMTWMDGKDGWHGCMDGKDG